jgi:membrane protease YdiL (CAAX protease family)
MLGQIEVTVLLVGIFGLFLGYMVNIRYIRTGRPTLKDRSNLLNFGVGMFIVTTLISSALAGWAQYTQSLQDMGAVIVLSAAPFEEALFRFAIASMLYRGINPFTERTLGSSNITGRVTSSDFLTMILTALITSWLFVQFHMGVYGESDPLVHTILFVNSFIYTMVFLYTSDIMTSTTAHLLHNAVALFL